MFRGTSTQTQPQPSIPHVIMPLPYPPAQPTPSAIQTTTNDIVVSFNETKLNDDIAESTKRPKQHHSMDFEKDHPKLTIPLQAVNKKDITLHHSPPGISNKGTPKS